MAKLPRVAIDLNVRLNAVVESLLSAAEAEKSKGRSGSICKGRGSR